MILRRRPVGWLVVLVLLLRAIGFGWAAPAEAGQGAAPISGWVVCSAHGAKAAVPPPTEGGGHTTPHSLACEMCVAGCAASMAAAAAIDPLFPSATDPVARRTAADAASVRVFSALRNARAPPSRA